MADEIDGSRPTLVLEQPLIQAQVREYVRRSQERPNGPADGLTRAHRRLPSPSAEDRVAGCAHVAPAVPPSDLTSDRRALSRTSAVCQYLYESSCECSCGCAWERRVNQRMMMSGMDHMPVEDVMVRGPGTLSPLAVAKLRLPPQEIGEEDNLKRMDATSMSPWRVTEAHRPLGTIMRTRKEAYRQSSILRHQVNHQVRREPRSLAEVSGS